MEAFVDTPSAKRRGVDATVIFYLYLVTAVLYLTVNPAQALNNPDSDITWWLILAGAFGSLLISLLARSWALWIARTQILTQRAKALIARSGRDYQPAILALVSLTKSAIGR